MLLPKFPSKLGTDHVLSTLLEIYLDWSWIRLSVLERINVLPNLAYFHKNDPCRWVIVVWVLDFHASIVLLIQRDNIFSTLWYPHPCVIRLMLFVVHGKACVAINRVDLADDKGPKVFKEIVHTHVKWTVFRTTIVIELISQLLCPSNWLKGPFPFPNSWTPRVSNLHKTVSIYINEFKERVCMVSNQTYFLLLIIW